MVAQMYGGLRARVRLLVVAVAACAVACATSSGPESATATGQVLRDVLVEHQDGVTVVALVGAPGAAYEVREQSDPPAIVVELSAVALDLVMGPVPVYDGLVEQVSASEHEDTNATRVEIALMGPASHEVIGTENGLSLRLWSPDDSEALVATADEAIEVVAEIEEDVVAEVDEEEIEDVWAVSDLLSGGEDATGMAVEETAAELEWEEPPFAENLQSISVETVDAGVLIHLVADGVIGTTEVFTLEDPSRLVIDLQGLTSQVTQKQIDVATDLVSRIRNGAHADKVRVVIDGADSEQGFEGRRLMPVPDGMLLTLGEGVAVDDALRAGMDRSDEAWRNARLASGAAEIVAEPVIELAVETVIEPEPEVEAEPVVELAAEPVVEPEIEIAAEPVETIEAVDAIEPVETIEAIEPVEVVELVEFVEPLEDPWAAAPPDDGETVATIALDEDVIDSIDEIVAVHGVHYESDRASGVERIAVLAEAPVEVESYEPDTETFILSVKNAVLVEGAGGRIAPDSRGPLGLITTFQQPEMDPPEVRVVVKRSPGLPGAVTVRGSLVFLDFPIGHSQAETTAALDPALAVVPEVPSPTEPQMPTEVAEGVEETVALLKANPEILGAPAALAPAAEAASFELAAVDPVALAAPADPASLEPPAAIEILQQGGLIDGKEYQGRRVSLDFKDVEIADVLRLIAEVSDLNVIAGDEVTGKVTIRLVDVPWDQALDVILLTKGLGFVRVGNVLRIAPTAILAQEEEARLHERRAKEKLEDLTVKLIAVNYANVKDMQKLVKRLLSARGSVNVDTRTSTIIVKDIASVIDESAALIHAVDTETPQVMIEAKIVEANLDFSRELGSVWALNTQQQADPFVTNGAPRTNLGSSGVIFHDQNGRGNNVSFVNNITAAPTGMLNLAAFILNEKFNVELQLQAAESTGNGKVISSPRIVTLDNTDAEIVQGVSIPFQTFENGDAKLEFVDAVLSLKVTPHITANSSIIMKIEVTRDAPDPTVPTSTGSPAIAKNQAKTETLVKDGQTLVLGGIYTIEKSFRQSRVPYLHAIPILGSAFKSKEISDKRKELLIFVTPRIVLAADSDA